VSIYVQYKFIQQISKFLMLKKNLESFGNCGPVVHTQGSNAKDVKEQRER